MYLDPPLVGSEVDFLAGFSSRSLIRRVWPGQPNARCPWRVTPDGRSLDLDLSRVGDDASDVGAWLRFLCHEFLAPSSIDALHTALAHRLRGGHHVSGRVVIGGVLEITADRNRISERVLLPEHDAVVLQFGRIRSAAGRDDDLGQGRLAER